MDAATRDAEIRDVAVRIGREIDFAKKAMGIRPDLSLANHYARTACSTLDELANLIIEAAQVGVVLPLDFVDEVNEKERQLHALVLQISECNSVVANRSAKVAAGAVLN